MIYESWGRRTRKHIKHLVNSGKVSADNTVIIFGAGESSKEAMDILREFGIKISRIVDNDVRKQGKYCSGVEIEDPVVIKEQWQDGMIVLFYSYYHADEMASQLKGYGLKENRDFFSLVRYEFMQNTVWKQTYRVLQGLKLYNKLRKKYPDCEKILLCPYTGTGDVYLIGGMLQQYLEQQDIHKYVFIVVSTACRKIAQLFDIQNIEQLQGEMADYIVKANVFCPDRCDVLVLNDSWVSVYTNPTERLRGYKGLNFTAVFRNIVFQIKGDLKLSFPDWRRNTEEAQAFLKEHHMIQGRTVILAPYSNTLSEFPNRMWEQLVVSLHEKGYVVCTNSCGPKEPPIKGTEGVFFPLSIAAAVVSLAGGFIGARCGLCDIISSASAKKVIIYDKDSYFYQATTKAYFSLNDMGLCQDAIELDYVGDIDSVVGQVLANF
ncbi:MAG: hypothetical protein K2H41_07550 [Acetatifactor sp.]|nr:hypothetical protein [Acetatifactor sp.]